MTGSWAEMGARRWPPSASGPRPTGRNGPMGQKIKPNLSSRGCVGEKVRLQGLSRSESAVVSDVSRGWASNQRDGNRSVGNGPSTLASSPVANSTAPAGVCISGGEHAQQGGAAARAVRPGPPANASHGTGPDKTVMHGCVLLGLRFIHRTKPPTSRNATWKSGPRSTFPWAGGNPNSSGGGHPGVGDRTSRRAVTRCGDLARWGPW